MFSLRCKTNVQIQASRRQVFRFFVPPLIVLFSLTAMQASGEPEAQHGEPTSTSVADEPANTACHSLPAVQANENTEDKGAEKEEGARGTQDLVPNVDFGSLQESAARGWKFWAIFTGLCIASLLAAVDGTVTSTALPTIVHDLEAEGLYVWFVNAFFLSRLLYPQCITKPHSDICLLQYLRVAPIRTNSQHLWSPLGNDWSRGCIHSWKWYLWRGSERRHDDCWPRFARNWRGWNFGHD